jgi:hypothetical protein
MALSAVLIAALGFIGGVEVQKHDGTSTASAASPGAQGATARGGFGGRQFGGAPGAAGGAGAAGAAGGAGNVTFGTVASKKGRYVYVKDSDGNLVRVKATSHSTINRTASARTSAIHPGDTVVVQGPKSKNGTVTATRITASAAGTAPGGGGGFLGGGGGGFPGGGGGGAPGGATAGAAGG